MGLAAVPKKHLVNLVSLTCIQGSNAALPLLVFPFALAVLGEGPYAQIVLAEALAIVALTFVIYGFDIDGVARVVGLQPGRDQVALSQAFSAVLYARLLLCAVAAPPVLAAAWLLDERLVPLTLSWLLIPLSYALQANWFFQGVEQNAPVAMFTLLSRAAAVLLVVLMVRQPADQLRVPAIVGLAYLAGATASLLYVLQRFGIRLVAISRGTVKELLWSGKEIFASNLCVILYRDLNVLVLGALGGSPAAVAAYSMAEKIVKGIQASMRPLNQLLFPAALRIAQSVGQPGHDALRRLLRISWPQVVVQVVIFVLLVALYLAFATDVGSVGRFDDIDRIAILVAIMNGASVLGVLNFMLGWAGLNAMGKRRYMFGAIAVTSLTSLAACVGLVSRLEDQGAALCFVGAETLLLSLVLFGYRESAPKRSR